MLVKESLFEFERGGDPKNVLGIGKKHMIEEWLKSMEIENYHINQDLTIDVKKNGWRGTDLSERGLVELPDYIQFNVVDEYFDISHNNLITLRGCPKIVNGEFFCSDNKLSDFEYLPKKFKGIAFANNPIISLTGLEKLPGGTVYPILIHTSKDPLKLIVDAIQANFKLGKTSINTILKTIKNMDSNYVNNSFKKYKVLNDIFNPTNRKFYKDRTESEIDQNIEEAVKMLEKAGYYYVSTPRMQKNKTLRFEERYKNWKQGDFNGTNGYYSTQWIIYKSNALSREGSASPMFEHPFYMYTDFVQWFFDYNDELKR
jgi:hypothetical protein